MFKCGMHGALASSCVVTAHEWAEGSKTSCLSVSNCYPYPSSLTCIQGDMFSSAISFNQDLSNWDISSGDSFVSECNLDDVVFAWCIGLLFPFAHLISVIHVL